MGKRYVGELDWFPRTLEWAASAPLGPLEDFIDASGQSTLVALGSGGSTTAAHFAALLHRWRNEAAGFHTTPLDIILSSEAWDDRIAAIILSASGRNGDVLAALAHLVDRGVGALATVSTQDRTPLGAAARAVSYASVFERRIPAGKDGFLATNSLLATCALLARAYGAELPSLTESALEGLPDLSDRDTVQVLHGGWGSPTATDLESKLNESGLASTLVADYRNFGHGRHLALARRSERVFVIAVVTPDIESLARRTLTLLPPDVPIIEIRSTASGPAATIDTLVQAMHLVGLMGEAQSFDPGRPTVPTFGRRMYHLRPPVVRPLMPASVFRKRRARGILSRASEGAVETAREQFVERLQSLALTGLVLDYDGTLCETRHRFDPLASELSDEIGRLVRAGVHVGIATGRGRSVRQRLQEALPPALWPEITVGYYNGSAIGSLAEKDIPDSEGVVDSSLEALRASLEDDPGASQIFTLELRPHQLTVQPHPGIGVDAVYRQVSARVAHLGSSTLQVVASSHSVDVLSAGVSKYAVIDALVARGAVADTVLCIGDRGSWPGNDWMLLNHSPSLSVDEVSASLETCWNLAPAGVTGPAATLRYLRAMRSVNGEMGLDVAAIGRAP